MQFSELAVNETFYFPRFTEAVLYVKTGNCTYRNQRSDSSFGTAHPNDEVVAVKVKGNVEEPAPVYQWFSYLKVGDRFSQTDASEIEFIKLNSKAYAEIGSENSNAVLEVAEGDDFEVIASQPKKVRYKVEYGPHPMSAGMLEARHNEGFVLVSSYYDLRNGDPYAYIFREEE